LKKGVLIFPQNFPKKSILVQEFNRESGQSTPKTKGRLTEKAVNLPVKVGKSPKNGRGSWIRTTKAILK